MRKDAWLFGVIEDPSYEETMENKGYNLGSLSFGI